MYLNVKNVISAFAEMTFFIAYREWSGKTWDMPLVTQTGYLRNNPGGIPTCF